jgi:regulator of protease activity HflC (stomatin/prohibitin superfamily)
MEKNSRIWVVFFLILLIISVAIGLIADLVLSSFGINSFWAVLVGLVVFVSIAGKAVLDGWCVVPQKWEYIVEIFGPYIGEPLGPRLYVLFTWFGFVRIRARIFMGVQKMELYLDEKIEDGYGGGNVEFEDCSSGVKSFFYFQITDSGKAAYATNGLLSALEEKADSILRAFLGIYKLEEVIKIKNNFYMQAIATLTDFCPDTPLDEQGLEILKKKVSEDWKTSEFYASLNSWGVEPIDLIISDIELTPSIDAARQTILEAEKQLEAAKIVQEKAKIDKETKSIVAEGDKVVAIKKAEGEKQREILVGEGKAEQIRKIAAAGIPYGQVANLLIKTKQWEAIEKGGNTVTVIEDATKGGQASQGARFGAGFSSNKKQTN